MAAGSDHSGHNLKWDGKASWPRLKPMHGPFLHLTVDRAVSQHPEFCSTAVKLTNIFVATSIFSDGLTSFFPTAA